MRAVAGSGLWPRGRLPAPHLSPEFHEADSEPPSGQMPEGPVSWRQIRTAEVAGLAVAENCWGPLAALEAGARPSRAFDGGSGGEAE